MIKAIKPQRGESVAIGCLEFAAQIPPAVLMTFSTKLPKGI